MPTNSHAITAATAALIQPDAGKPSLSPEEAELITHRLLAKVEAHGEVEQFIRVKRAVLYRDLKAVGAYASKGLTWAGFCRDAWDLDHAVVDEEIRNLDAFGFALFEAFERVGLSRDTMRDARRLTDGQIRVLKDSGEIVIGEKPIPVDARHKDAITEAIQALNQDLNYLRNRVEDADAAVAEKNEELQARAEEIGGLKARLQEKKALEKQQKRYTEVKQATTGEIVQGLFIAADVLSQLTVRAEVERPDPEEVRSAVSVIAPILSRLTDYTRHREKLAEQAPGLDPEALDVVLRGFAEDDDEELVGEEGPDADA